MNNGYKPLSQAKLLLDEHFTSIMIAELSILNSIKNERGLTDDESKRYYSFIDSLKEDNIEIPFEILD